MRRRVLPILATMVLGVLLLGGAALAATIDGTASQDDLVGKDKDDTIHGGGGRDYISGLAGNDSLWGGSGTDTVVGREDNDTIYGNADPDYLFGNLGNDTIYGAGDRQEDVVNCGAGVDTAYVDKLDRVSNNCENVFVRVT